MTESKNVTPLAILANGLEHRVLEWTPEPAVGAVPAANRDARTVVLLHGFMDAGASWDLVAPALASRGFRVLAPDLRGFGEGARVSAGGYYHFADYVLDVAEITSVLVPNGTFALVGHSMGGTVATLFAGAFPERVSHLASLEGLGPPDHPFEAGPVRMRSWIEQVRTTRERATKAGADGSLPLSFPREEAARRLAMNHPNVPREVLESRAAHLTQEVAPGRLAWRADPLHRTTSPVPFFAKLFVEFAKRVTCPVLFVSGGPTGFHPPDEEERLASFASLERRTIEDAGHMMHWTKPDDLAATLGSFLG